MRARIVLYITAAYITVVLCGVLLPFLSGERLVGWDLYPQYYLAELMVENLSRGSLRGYDPNWFAGYPSFTFYGSIPYLSAALIHFVSFKTISVTLALNLIIFSLPFLFLVSLAYYVRVASGPKAVIYSLIFGVFYLLYPSSPHLGPFGIFGSLFHGHFAAFFSIVLMLFLFGTLERMESEIRARYLIQASILLALVLASHLMTSIFTVIYATTHAIFHGRKHLYALLIVFAAGLALSAFSWLPLVANLRLASGEMQLISDDALLNLFPDFITIKRCLTDMTRGAPIGYILCSLSVFVTALIGIVSYIRARDYFLPFILVLSLLILPRNFFSHIFDFAVHYNRFIFPMIPILIAIASRGAIEFAGVVTSMRSRLTSKFVGAVFSLLVAWPLLCVGIQNYEFAPWSSIKNTPIFNVAFYSCDARNLTSPPPYESELDVTRDLLAVRDFLLTLGTVGRIAVQTSEEDFSHVYTPHLLSTWLPLNAKLPVVPGLLAESSASGEYIIPVLGFLTRGMIWGRNRIWGMMSRGPSVEALIKRLALFNVEYLITTNKNLLPDYLSKVLGLSPSAAVESGGSTSDLHDRQIITAVKSFGDYHLFKISNPRPLLSSITYRPYLFVSRGGIDFREFSERWYQVDALLDFPVIHSTKEFSDLLENEKDSIGGFIVSFKPGTVLNQEDIKMFLDSGKDLILLDGEIDISIPASNSVKVLSSSDRNSFDIDLPLILQDSAAQTTEIKAEIFTDTSVRFDHLGGVIINYSFFPWWQDVNGKITVFEVSPSLMFVFAQGNTELRYTPRIF